VSEKFCMAFRQRCGAIVSDTLWLVFRFPWKLAWNLPPPGCVEGKG